MVGIINGVGYESHLILIMLKLKIPDNQEEEEEEAASVRSSISLLHLG